MAAEVFDVSAIVPAGGKGRRMGQSQNKQYLELKGVPILAHTWRVLARLTYVKEIILVVADGEQDYCRRKVVDPFKDGTKIEIKIVVGGAERQDSVYQGLKASNEKLPLVMIHDGARPLVTKSIIDKTYKEAIYSGAAVCGVPVKDTIKIVRNNKVIKTPERDKLWAVHTPQIFTRELINQAYNEAVRDGFMGTDDSSLVERLNTKPVMVKSSYNNFKITTPEDMTLAEKILTERGSG